MKLKGAPVDTKKGKQDKPFPGIGSHNKSASGGHLQTTLFDFFVSSSKKNDKDLVYDFRKE